VTTPGGDGGVEGPLSGGRRLLLADLRVRDLGVIEDVTVGFGAGLNVLTGETGAGKTLLVDALHLLLGGRADAGAVRAGASEAVVEGRFVDEAGEAETVLARSVSATGRSRAEVDGRMVTVAALAEVGAGLVELHGQHQHRALVTPSAQRRALDAFGRVDTAPLRAARRRLAVLEEELAGLGGDAAQREREADLLRFQVEEIAAAAIESPDEDVSLAAEEETLSRVTEHRQAVAGALDLLVDADGASVADVLAKTSGLLGGHLGLAEVEARVRGLMAEVSDVAAELRRLGDAFEDDPARLDEVRRRRQLLFDLGRKYGPGLDGVVATLGRARARLAELETASARAAELEAAAAAARRAVDDAAAVVATGRRRSGPELAAAVERTLQGLAMAGARLVVDVDGPGPADEVVFRLAANRGEPFQPLAKAASGGELARTMLAVRLAVGGTAGVLVFDEVDAGIGGRAADAVGHALARLGARYQVIVVTHLAQVAARAEHHLSVSKVERSGRTFSTVAVLDGEARVLELGRMLSGDPDSDVARAHARELLGRAGSPR
jgi:DNA repair protein RecN (Recombination protein N)